MSTPSEGTLISPAIKPVDGVVIVSAETGWTASAKPAPRLVLRKARRPRPAVISGKGLMISFKQASLVRSRLSALGNVRRAMPVDYGVGTNRRPALT